MDKHSNHSIRTGNKHPFLGIHLIKDHQLKQQFHQIDQGKSSIQYPTHHYKQTLWDKQQQDNQVGDNSYKSTLLIKMEMKSHRSLIKHFNWGSSRIYQICWKTQAPSMKH